MSGKSGSARFDGLKTAVQLVLAEGYPLASVLAQLHADTLTHPDLTDLDKAMICEKLAQVRIKGY